MRYSARTLTEALERPPIRFGRSDASLETERPLFWRVRRWWLRAFRTWTPRPISTPQMLALQASYAAGPLAYVLTLARTLRAVFPVRWWYALTGDPVRIILRLGIDAPDLQGLVLRTLVTVPGADRDESKESGDPYAAIRAAQRAQVYGEAGAGGPRLSLASAALSVRTCYGDTWYYNPDRWPTSDGYAPFALCLVEYIGLQAMDARRRLEVADGFAIAHAKDPQRMRSQLERVAYPTDLVS